VCVLCARSNHVTCNLVKRFRQFCSDWDVLPSSLHVFVFHFKKRNVVLIVVWQAKLAILIFILYFVCEIGYSL